MFSQGITFRIKVLLLLLIGMITTLTISTILSAEEVVEPVKIPLKLAENPRDNAELVWIPAGEFRMGVSAEEIEQMLTERADYNRAMFEDESPQHIVMLDGYWMYRNEVTVAQYRQFCTATKRPMPEQSTWSGDSFPVTNVSWIDANEYAKWANATLPTEAQWEKAARGDDARRFPWGNKWEVSRCNNYSNNDPLTKGKDGKHAAPVASFPTGDSPYGVHDMAGNVWEWCADWYAADYYDHAAANNPTGAETGQYRVLRGGSWGSSSKTCRVTARLSQLPVDTMHDDGGFRCVIVKGKVREITAEPAK